MAGTETKRIIELTEASTVQSGDFIAVDSNARGTKKVSTDTLATSAALTAETNARTGADEQMSERMDGIEEQTALIQNPTKTLSGALCSFTDGADMPMVACTAEIVPKQSGSGTPSPDNVRPISGWESVTVDVAGGNVINPSNYLVNNGGNLSPAIGSTPNYGGSGASASGENPVVVTISTGWKGLTLFSDELKAGIAIHLSLKLTANTTNAQISYYLMDSDNKVTTTPRVFYAQSAERTITDTITPTKNGERLAICVTSGVADSASLRDLAVSYGDTDYEPYIAPHTTTTPLGQTVYGGTLDVVSGVLTVDKGVVTFDGSSDEYWNAETYQSGTKFFTRFTDVKSDNNKTKPLMTNLFVFRAYSVADYGQITNVYWNTSNLEMTVPQTMTVEEWREFLQSTPLEIVYYLATPQTYTLTGHEVETLVGDNNVWADSGDVEITYRRDISIVLENLENALNGSNSLNTMMMSAPTENTAEEPTEDEAEDDMR